MPERQDVIDISLPLTRSTPPVPGDPPFTRSLVATHAADGCEVAALSLSAHSGTHLDFPAHFLPQGRRAGDYPARAFVLPAVVIDCGRASRLGPRLLDGADVGPGQAVLFRTGNSAAGLFAGPEFPEDFAALAPDLARELARRRVALVGLDALSIEPLTDPAYPAHHILLSAGVLILEGLDLRAAPAGRYTLLCPPLAMPEAEASPTRALLLPPLRLPAQPPRTAPDGA